MDSDCIYWPRPRAHPRGHEDFLKLLRDTGQSQMQTSKLRLKLMVGGWTETKKVELWLSREESRREARRDVGCRDATGKSAEDRRATAEVAALFWTQLCQHVGLVHVVTDNWAGGQGWKCSARRMQGTMPIIADWCTEDRSIVIWKSSWKESSYEARQEVTSTYSAQCPSSTGDE